MPELSQQTKKLISRYQNWFKFTQPQEGVAVIHVDEVASRVASFYEKMRGIIDWREEHLLRRTAIERILKRRLFLKKEGKDIAESLVHELIRGGHFPNDSIAENKILDAQRLIDKYIFIVNNAPAAPKEKMKIQLYDWLMSVAACEVEETLSPPSRESALMDYMLELMQERIDVKEGIFVVKGMSEEDKKAQTYIALQKALFKLDPPIISYNLIKRWYPDWFNLSQEALEGISGDIYLLWEKIEKNFHHPLSEKFYNICERYDTSYLILGDIISADPDSAKANLENPGTLESKIREAYQARLKKIKSRMGRAAFYSTLSIFLTKILTAFAIEVPFDKYVTGQFNYLTIGMSVLIPPLLMIFLIASIRPPSKQNAEMVVLEVMKIAYERERKDVYEVRSRRKRGFVLNSIMTLLYLASFIASFGFLAWGLRRFDFSVLSIVIFLIFISLISFAGAKIRQRAKELVVEREKDSSLFILFDLFSIPIIRVGRWLSSQWVKYNAVALLFNSLLDMPFQAFVEFFEQWRIFVKEKKEEIH